MLPAFGSPSARTAWPASRISNLFTELAAVRKLAADVPARRILESATRSGADALGFGDQLGTIEPHKRAELIAVRIPAGLEDVEEYLLSGIQPEAIHWLSSDREPVNRLNMNRT